MPRRYVRNSRNILSERYGLLLFRYAGTADVEDLFLPMLHHKPDLTSHDGTDRYKFEIDLISGVHGDANRTCCLALRSWFRGGRHCVVARLCRLGCKAAA